jgi:hypothetical protein
MCRCARSPTLKRRGRCAHGEHLARRIADATGEVARVEGRLAALIRQASATISNALAGD